MIRIQIYHLPGRKIWVPIFRCHSVSVEIRRILSGVAFLLPPWVPGICHRSRGLHTLLSAESFFTQPSCTVRQFLLLSTKLKDLLDWLPKALGIPLSLPQVLSLQGCAVIMAFYVSTGDRSLGLMIAQQVLYQLNRFSIQKELILYGHFTLLKGSKEFAGVVHTTEASDAEICLEELHKLFCSQVLFWTLLYSLASSHLLFHSSHTQVVALNNIISCTRKYMDNAKITQPPFAKKSLCHDPHWATSAVYMTKMTFFYVCGLHDQMCGLHDQNEAVYMTKMCVFHDQNYFCLFTPNIRNWLPLFGWGLTSQSTPDCLSWKRIQKGTWKGETWDAGTWPLKLNQSFHHSHFITCEAVLKNPSLRLKMRLFRDPSLPGLMDKCYALCIIIPVEFYSLLVISSRGNGKVKIKNKAKGRGTLWVGSSNTVRLKSQRMEGLTQMKGVTWKAKIFKK